MVSSKRPREEVDAAVSVDEPAAVRVRLDHDAVAALSHEVFRHSLEAASNLLAAQHRKVAGGAGMPSGVPLQVVAVPTHHTETQTDTPVHEVRANPNQPLRAASFFPSTDALRLSLVAGAYQVPAPQSRTSGYADLQPPLLAPYSSDVGGIASSLLPIDERIASASKFLAEMCGPTIAFNTYIANLVGAAAPVFDDSSSHVPAAAVAPPSFNLAPATYLIGGSALTSMILSGVMGGSGVTGAGSAAPSSSQHIRAEDIVPSFPRLAARAPSAIPRVNPELTAASEDVQKPLLASQSDVPHLFTTAVPASDSGVANPISPVKPSAPTEALVEKEEEEEDVLIIDDDDNDEVAMSGEEDNDDQVVSDDEVIIL